MIWSKLNNLRSQIKGDPQQKVNMLNEVTTQWMEDGKEKKLLGVVLCGGQSTRMGSDKGLLLHQNKTWAQVAFEKLESFSIPVIVSINVTQHDAYTKYFKPNQLIEDNNALNIGGPLLGLLSIHRSFPQQDLLVLACDLIDMKLELLHTLLEHYQNKKEYQAIVFKGKYVEPLCGIYTANGLAEILELHQQKKLMKHSMHEILNLLNTEYLQLHEEMLPWFRNVNSANS